MDPTIAEIRLFAGNFAPLSWAFCNGQLLSIAENTALFSLVGTTYGGDGQVTFALPDFRGRIAVGTGTGPGLSPTDLGEVAGTETVTLMTSQIPAHVHPSQSNGTSAAGNTGDTAGNFLATANQPTYALGSPSNKMGSGTVTVGPTGGTQPHNNIMPVLALNFIIATEGMYPARN